MWGRKRDGARITAAVGAYEERMRSRTDADLRALTDAFRTGLAAGETLDALLPEVLAAGREAGVRTLGQRAVDAQVAGAAALCRGRLVEMKTGEGKTLAIALAAYAWSLAGEGVHVFTANSYLAERDAEWMRPLYEALGVSCALIVDEPRAAREGYQADVAYLTTDVAARHYLRDNTAQAPGERIHRPLRRAIVDEADLVLIEDARCESFISTAVESDEFVSLYRRTAAMVARLDPAAHCVIDERRKMVTLTDQGTFRVEDLLGAGDLYQDTEPELQRALDDCLRARFTYRRDREYVLVDGGVAGLNAATGRVDVIAGLPEGLAQAIEIKEGLKPSPRRLVLGKISHRGLLRRYRQLAGATGTALEDRLYREAYGLEIERIPTHAPVLRIDHAPLFYPADEPRTQAALKRVAEKRAAGRPVLVVTTSIAQCAELSAALIERGIPHELLTANNHRQEAEIFARAGMVGAVTVVTRMAGRGVDIRLGGDDPDEHEAVVRAGGLYVLGLDIYESRRMELHLRGRAGRRGDPGESDVLLSMQTPETAALFSESVRRTFSRMVKGTEPLDSGFLLERALLRSLDRHTQRLEHYTLDQFIPADIRDEQAAEIYRLRDEYLDGERTQGRVGARVIDKQWPRHLVALEDAMAESTLHGLTGSAWRARYRQEANRLYRQLRTRIDAEIEQADPTD